MSELLLAFKKNNWKTEETLARTVVTLETRRNRSKDPILDVYDEDDDDDNYYYWLSTVTLLHKGAIHFHVSHTLGTLTHFLLL
jgi:hypothetical protein